MVTPSGSGRERHLGVTESFEGVSPLAGGARREFERGFKEVLVMGEALGGWGSVPATAVFFRVGYLVFWGWHFFLWVLVSFLFWEWGCLAGTDICLVLLILLGFWRVN